MTEYSIFSKVLDNPFLDNIDEALFNELKQAKEILFEMHLKENVYNMVLMNYYEFEKELFDILFNYRCSFPNYHDINDFSLRIEQRLLNIFSSSKLYLESFTTDKYKQCTEYLADEFLNIQNFKLSLNEDKKFKIMMFLRNHLQHNGLLIENWSLGETLNLFIPKHSIKARDYNISEFKDIEDDIDLKKYIRQYMDYISAIHKHFRETTNVKTQNARISFEKILNSYPEYRSLQISKTENNCHVEFAIFLELDDVRIALTKKNNVPTYFKKHSINTK